MWFQALSLVIATALLVKAVSRSRSPADSTQRGAASTDSTSMPRELLVPPAIILCVTSIAWYSTFVHYRPWGWVVTGSLTLLCSLSLTISSAGGAIARPCTSIVANPRVWIVDCVLLVVGAGFAALGLLVYGGE